ncbi:MAG: phosphoadenosine phosphosulfate reductase family protein, partial [Sphaerochaeta sp.]|nr:phosphoadenosine phosphosulfate reductase family protein [Sphaerochaeta sp.]
MIEKWQLQQRMGQPLDIKIQMSLARIKAWYDHYDGEVYISYSGGLDSSVLLHLIRSVYPDVPAATAHELMYPEILEHVKATENVTIFRPRKTFNEVVQRYGYPVVSKKVAMGISRYRNTMSEAQRQLRLHGGTNPTSGKKQHPSIPMKWHYLVNAPFQISERCCDILKKEPLHRAGKILGHPFIGTRSSEGWVRQMDYLKHGCNAFDKAIPESRPLAFWTSDDIWEYVHRYNVPYSRIYDMGYRRTGCFACMFGVHLEDEPNRFQLMQKTHPGLWRYCQRIGIPEVLDYIGVDY